MPIGMKAAPPQQVSLNELWTSKAKGTKPKKEPRATNSEQHSEKEGKRSEASAEQPSSAYHIPLILAE